MVIHMQDVEMQTDILLEAIKKSRIYNQYQRLLEHLKKNQELYQEVNEFRKQKFFGQINQEQNFLEESDKLLKQYDKLLNNELVAEFLVAEQRYCKMMKGVNERILSNINMNVDFLED